MVNGVISIVPAVLVVHIVDAIVHAAEMTFRITFINKRMLRPVAHHHDQSCIDDRHNKNHQGSFEIYKAKRDTYQVKREFTKGQSCIEFFPLALKEVKKCIDNTNKKE